jgi:hypothetical protein
MLLMLRFNEFPNVAFADRAILEFEQGHAGTGVFVGLEDGTVGRGVVTGASTTLLPMRCPAISGERLMPRIDSITVPTL